MPILQGHQQPRFEPGEVIISEVTKDDLQSIAEGYYASFPIPWFDKMEPPPLRPSDDHLRVSRFATRMLPWISEPHTRWTKATLSPSSSSYNSSAPNRVIGHAGWLLPERTAAEVVNFWRKDASDALDWRSKMGWTQEYEEDLWSGTNIAAYQGELLMCDRVRQYYMSGTGHWLLAPLWVLPEYQGRGVASLLLRDGIELADKKRSPMYLEAMAEARVIYEHFGYQGVEGEGEPFVMIRNPPDGVRVLAEKN